MLDKLSFIFQPAVFSANTHSYVRKGSRSISSASLSKGSAKISTGQQSAPAWTPLRPATQCEEEVRVHHSTVDMKSIRVLSLLLLTSAHICSPGGGNHSYMSVLLGYDWFWYDESELKVFYKSSCIHFHLLVSGFLPFSVSRAGWKNLPPLP